MLKVLRKLDTRSFELNEHHFAIRYDPESNIIYSKVQGFWSVANAAAYVKAMKREMAERRTQNEIINVLVDRRETPVLSAEVADLLQKANREIYISTDRLAIVVDSSLLKMQLRRLFSHEGSKAFLSIDAALTWLQAR